MSVLELRGVRYGYAGTARPVLDGVDLSLEAGEVLGVVGRTDAGKSTLCLVAAGLAPAAIGGRLEGEVRLVDRLTSELRPHEAAQRAGILFQNPLTQLSGTVPTVFEEVALGPRNLGLTLAEVVERVEHALEVLLISRLASRDPVRLSGGQAQLVALAAVLALQPRLLVLDEPTSQLDPVGTLLVGEALEHVGRELGTAILIVEHKTDLLERLATRILVLDGGRVAMDGATTAILSDPRLADHGAMPPASVRARRRAAEAGVELDLAALGFVP